MIKRLKEYLYEDGCKKSNIFPRRYVVSYIFQQRSEGMAIRKIVYILPVYFLAWIVFPIVMLVEPFSWFLNPIVNNTPAFITVSKGLAQSLLIANVIGFSMYKLSANTRLSVKDWRVAGLLVASSLIHIAVVSVIIFLLVGYEDL
ncbi:hypothetical protein PAEN110709_24820 [Paenibacillus endophyticus]